MKNQEIKQILIVDDKRDNLQIIENILEKNEKAYKIIKAPNGEIAFKLSKKKIPDLIITDWDMPVMNGIELIKELKKDVETCHIPVIMCTGVMTTSENLQTALSAGAIDYIRKPVDEIELIARVHSVLLFARSQNTILRKNAELQEHVETKEKFFSIIAHDLRSPIGTLNGFIDLLHDNLDTYNSEEIKSITISMKKIVHHYFQLLVNLLDWSRVQAGKLIYNPEFIDLRELISENIDSLKQNAKIKNIELITTSQEKIKIFADDYMMNTILRNLISNAIKFTPKGGKIILACKTENEAIHISVSDSGVGIENDRIKEILDRTGNATTHGTENEKGSGLGLYLCKEFIDMHGGEFEIKSELGAGSEFIVKIPNKEK